MNKEDEESEEEVIGTVRTLEERARVGRAKPKPEKGKRAKKEK